MAKIPDFQVLENEDGGYKVTVDGVDHFVKIEGKGGGSYYFWVDDEGRQSCHGHPVNDDQAPGYPPAAIISIVKGPKGNNLPWSAYWDYI